MFRQGLRRCARPASSLRSVSMLARPRASIAVSSNTTIRAITPLRTLPSIIKSYSTEAAAEAIESQPAEEVTDFDDLEGLGVHPNILNSITKDMGYKTMTPVQAKTINPALKGTDMLVPLTQPYECL